MNRNGHFDEPPPGFRALAPTLPVTVYRRHLPHWRQDGATYFVTFRLADALPRERIAELRDLRERWLAAHPEPTQADWEAYQRLEFARLEEHLDAGHGSRLLADRRARQAVEETLRFFDGERYRLGCWVVMPTHVHAVVKPLPVGRDGIPSHSGQSESSVGRDGIPSYKLESIVGTWKRQSAKAIHERLGGSGTLWQDEVFDRIVRDTPELRRTVAYIERNPVKAGIRAEFWLCDEWEVWFRGGPVGRDGIPSHIGTAAVGRDGIPSHIQEAFA